MCVLSRLAVWIDTCYSTIHALRCGPEVKEAIKTVMTAINFGHLGCTNEDIEKLQPLVKPYEALVEEQEKLKQVKTKRSKMFQAF